VFHRASDAIEHSAEIDQNANRSYGVADEELSYSTSTKKTNEEKGTKKRGRESFSAQESFIADTHALSTCLDETFLSKIHVTVTLPRSLNASFY
jgi:hypothetical protein